MSELAEYDVAIQQASEQVRRAQHLAAKRASLDEEMAQATDRVEVLREAADSGAAGVERLERRSLASLVSGVLGGREERLTHERAQAALALTRLEGERRRLEELARQLAAVQTEEADIAAAEEVYDRALAAKEQVVRASGAPGAAELTRIAKELGDVESLLREHAEARGAGLEAERTIRRVQTCLTSARSVGDWDALGADGYGDLTAYSYLRNAEEAAWQGQQLLDRLAAELADIGEQVAPRLPEIDPRWFAKMFYDSVITESLRNRRLDQTLEATRKLADWLAEDVIARLTSDCDRLAARREQLLARREELLVEADYS